MVMVAEPPRRSKLAVVNYNGVTERDLQHLTVQRTVPQTRSHPRPTPYTYPAAMSVSYDTKAVAEAFRLLCGYRIGRGMLHRISDG